MPICRAETVEEKDFRVRAEKRQQRTERAAQISSLAILSLLLIASTLFLVLAYTGWYVHEPCCPAQGLCFLLYAMLIASEKALFLNQDNPSCHLHCRIAFACRKCLWS